MSVGSCHRSEKFSVLAIADLKAPHVEAVVDASVRFARIVGIAGIPSQASAGREAKRSHAACPDEEFKGR